MDKKRWTVSETIELLELDEGFITTMIKEEIIPLRVSTHDSHGARAS